MNHSKIICFWTFFFALTFPIVAISQVESDSASAFSYSAEKFGVIDSVRFARTLNHLEQTIRQNPRVPDAFIRLTALFRRGGVPNEGLLFLRKLLQENPANPYIYDALGRFYFDQKNYPKSAKYYRQAIRLNLDFPPSFRGYIDVMQKQGKLAEAVELIDAYSKANPANAALFYARGYCAQVQKNWQKGLGYLRKALTLNPYLLEAYQATGVVYFFTGQYRKMVQTAQIGLKCSSEKNKPEFQCHFWGDLGLADAYLARYPAAFAAIRRALKLARKIGSRKEAVRNLINLGMLNQRLGNYKEALKSFGSALAVTKQAADRRQEALILRNIGSVYRQTDHYAKALLYFQRSLPILDAAGEKRVEGLVYWSMSLTHWDFGNYARARALCRKALTIAQTIGDQWGEERYGGTLGLLNWHLGQYSEALDDYQRALALSRKSGDKEGEELWLGNLAILFDELGNLPKSLAYYRKALTISKNIGNRRAEARQIGNMAAVYRKMGNLPKAQKALRQALKIEETTGNQKDRTVYLIELAAVFNQSGNPQKAKMTFRKALRTARKIGAKQSEGNCSLGLGESHVSTGHFPQALHFYRNALRIGQATKNVSLIWQSNAGLGKVYSQKKQFKKSLRFYEKALHDIETLRAGIPTDQYKIGFLSTKTPVYDQILHVLAELHRRFPSGGYDKKSFQWVERAKARSLLEIVFEGKIFQTLKKIPSKFREEFLLNQKELALAYRDFSREQSQPKNKQNPPLLRHLADRVDSLKRAKAHILAALQKKSPKYFELTNPTLLKTTEVQTKILKKNQLLIEYWVGEDETYFWAIDKSRLIFKSLHLGRRTLAQKLAQISPLFNPRKRTEQGPTDHRWANIRPELLHDLYGILLEKPAGNLLKRADTLLIVPDDRLFYFPFELLVRNRKGNAPHYLIEDFPISYAASASLLNPELRKIQPAPKEFFALGNPDFSKKDRPNGSNRLLFWNKRTSSKQMPSLSPLPGAAAEVQMIAKNFATPTVLTGKKATEERFKNAAPNYRFLHLATHFLINDVHPMHSKIVLSQSGGEIEDGFLQTFEIYNLRLRAEMVVLSGCQSGLGTLRRGEGIIGLTRAFLFAGVPNIVVSLWAVEDQSTARLMNAFYRNLRRGVHRSQALQQAKIELLHSPDQKQNPFYWAPFVLIGR